MINDNRLLPLPGSGNLDRPLHDFASASSANLPSASGAPSDQANLRDYLNVVLKRKWLILSIMVIVTTLTAIYVYRQPSIYEAQTTIQIEQKQKSFLKTAEISINTGNDPTYRNTQLKLLENAVLLRQVIVTLDLPNNPAFFGNNRGGLITAARQVFSRKESKSDANEGGITVANDEMKGNRGNEAAAFNAELSKEQLARLEPYEDALRAGLTIEPVEKTNLINIIFVHTDPQVAMNVANTLAAVFIANDLNSQTSGSLTQEQKLARQVIELQMQLQQLEARRANFMLGNNIPLGDMKGMNLTAQRLEMLSGEALKSETDRKNIKASYDAAARTSDLQSIPEVQNHKGIQAMRERISLLEEKRTALLIQYTEIHPAVQQVNKQIEKLQRDIDTTARQVVAGLESQYKAAIARENDLTAAYLKERGAATRITLAETTLSSLNQELETTKQLYNTALQRQKEIEISGSDNKSNVTVATPSREPREPVGPQRARNITLALFLSLGMGIGLSILLDHLDDTLKSVEDVERYIHLPMLALIPAPRVARTLLRGKERGGDTEIALHGAGAPHTALTLIEEARSPVAEAYRHLRTSLLLSSAGQPPRTVLVTSSQPSEGKTTTAVNTAMVLAQTGAEVVLVDCDLRRPRIHAHFGMGNARGLTNYLAGEADVDGIVQTYPKLPNLKVLPAGLVPPNPAELLGSEEMRKLLRELSERFTHVIIDSPPAISFTDAAILSTLVDGVMLVVHGGRSSRAVVRRARQQMLDVGAHIYGIVLNNVKLESSDYNYYAGYYASYYEETEAATDTEEELVGSSNTNGDGRER